MIKKIDAAEFDNLGLHGKGATGPIYNAILNMKPGEAIIVEKKTKSRYTPLDMVRNIERKYTRKYERGTLPDRSGWAIKRVS